MTPRRLAVKALIHQEQAGYANLVLDAELKKCDPPMNTRDALTCLYSILPFQKLQT